VSAVKLTTAALPAEINPASDLTGPLKVDFAILSLLNYVYRLGESARAVDKPLILSLVDY
jgi:hypothetical protein